jgi:membrane protease YdiL (CAAX protease family)
MLAGYLALGFVLEEVAFRGLVDAHVHHRGEGRQWQSALFVSALWGMWHLPLVIGTLPTLLLPVALFVPYILIGLPLSFAWRRGGNLALPVGAHAVIDAVRDGLAAAV